MVLTKTFPPATFSRALESWAWIDLAGKVPVLASLSGDVFLQHRTGYWWLDLIEGSLSKVAAGTTEFQTMLETPEAQDRYLLGGLALRAKQRGLVLKQGEVYDFLVPPVLGGKVDSSNIGVQDFVVALTIAGHVHYQIRDLPPGTQITGLTVDGQKP